MKNNFVALLPRPEKVNPDVEEVKTKRQIISDYMAESKSGFSVSRALICFNTNEYTLIIGAGASIKELESSLKEIQFRIGSKYPLTIEPQDEPGKVLLIEPRENFRTVQLLECLNIPEFRDNDTAKIPFTIGLDSHYKAISSDLADLPHLLIGGATGSGKSVLLHSIICSMIYMKSREELRFIMIDTKQVELTAYRTSKHLIGEICTAPYMAINALAWAEKETKKRFKLFEKNRVRNIDEYNKIAKKPLERIVIIIDELADLMLHNKRTVEPLIASIAQLSRAAGVHLIIATQRPDTNVITGTIKANIPARIALRTATATDSITILGKSGAEYLKGNGDLLYMDAEHIEPVRVQAPYIERNKVITISVLSR